ncbi:transmembrane prolyl 4-hydroxylase-like isoform X1 [Ptychodera flava]|uniref:transmembrane prolyl 4-hydroxylase-like isoform X1 n=1 Tax=Ptychodera flava TaxID=63121 RepID=UPI003969C562
MSSFKFALFQFCLVMLCFHETSKTRKERYGMDKYRDFDPNGTRDRYCKPPACVPGTGRNLVRLDGVEVGYSRTLESAPGTTHTLITINMKPLIFEIPHFMSDEECDHLIRLAEDKGLQNSTTRSGRPNRKMALFDFNGDKKIDLNEMRVTMEDMFDMYLEEDEILEIYDQLDWDGNGDGILDRSELGTVTKEELKHFVMQWIAAKPHLRSRYSEQTWLYPNQVQDDIVDQFMLRIHSVLQLPEPLIDKHNEFQVVKYHVGGHYNAHVDSAPLSDLRCCHLTSSTQCRICRYATVMVYLTDVEEGGETAFPVANNASYNVQTLRTGRKLNLNRHCHESNLMVKPEKGKALVWYNHFIDEKTGWIGKVDNYTWHGGCPVVKGTKWIANRWINVSQTEMLI